MPDPSVSPADTIRRDPIEEAEDFVAAALVGEDWEVRDSDGEPPTWVERGVGDVCERFIEAPLSYAESCRIENLLNVAREFLAVGERDKAEIERLRGIIEANAKWLASLLKAEAEAQNQGERDRQQIARLTELVNAAEPGACIPPTDCTNHCSDGPCDCSGKWRIAAWKIDVPALRAVLAGEEDTANG